MGKWTHVRVDVETLAALDAEVKRRRQADGGRHSRSSVACEAIRDLTQRWHDDRELLAGGYEPGRE